MTNLSENFSTSANQSRPELEPPFSHIYMERSLLQSPRAQAILAHFPQAQIITIEHYKDVFNRSRQNASLQHQSQSIILAEKKGTLFYPGAPVCQDFGQKHFYYTSLCMNCPFDCDYCFLKGMYPSGHMVLFVNLQDYFQQLEQLLQKHPVYLCLSYDTDLCALESWTGYIEAFQNFLQTHPGLTLEVRTKSACVSLLERLSPHPSLIFAFTLSPTEVAHRYEHFTPSPVSRLKAAKAGIDRGHSVRICFDPMLFLPDWKQQYHELFELLLTVVTPFGLSQVRDFSIGTFRISSDYLKTFRAQFPASPLAHYPFRRMNGYAQYPPELAQAMECYLENRLIKYVGKEKIFRWEEKES